jgi:flavin-dependent dehydrogenase
MAAICVIGAGPAGSTFAVRMAELGHDVCLIERARFPRSHLGESLSRGVLPLLETIGVRAAIEQASFQRLRNVHVNWESGPQIREDPREEGLLVDRGAFDALLLERARGLGVRVLQPAFIRAQNKDDRGWRLEIEAEGEIIRLHADFLADARGRAAGAAGRKATTSCRTIALYAYWRGADIPSEPRIEAGSNAWYWGVPLPDGTYNTLAFIDHKHFRGASFASLQDRFLDLLQRSSLLAGCEQASLVGGVKAADATPYIHAEGVTASAIKLGEAGLALDPLSSSGVQKAIQSALAGAIVTNTLLRKPAATEAALSFYKSNLMDASERHCRWAASHYRSVALTHGGPFWNERAAAAAETRLSSSRGISADAQSLAAMRVSLSDQIEFVDLPCIDCEFVTIKPALRHPDLERPLVYLGGIELTPLLQSFPAAATPLQIAQMWSAKVPIASGLAIVSWLINNAILVRHPEVSAISSVDEFHHGSAEVAGA